MTTIRYPGFIDAHVHLRDPGATQKEDFATGTRAAVAGGVTFVIDMPNNPISTITLKRLEEKVQLVKAKAVCEVGFHFGTNGKNLNEFSKVMRRKDVFGLKIYLNHTTGEMLIEDLKLLENIFEAWKSTKPILVHAEGVQLLAAIALAQLYKRRLHVCHISQAIEVELVRRAKKAGMQITAGVTPHHLFLHESDEGKMGSFARMKPPLGHKIDSSTLWKSLRDRTIDIVETDHAPHTKKEKMGEKPPFGVPGVETVIPLMYLAVQKRLIARDLIKEILYKKPREIFSIPLQKNTYVEIDESRFWKIGEGGYQSKCGWSPFDGWKVPAKIVKVVVGGRMVVENGKVIV
jgi:carbamoyl-phosphate synthase/aspartate carbamoyltransferase/dihydroorotase